MQSFILLMLLLWLPVSDSLNPFIWHPVTPKEEFYPGVTALNIRKRVKHIGPLHLEIAKSYVGTIEATGNNDGPKIEYIIRRGHGAPHSPYCAYFVTLCIDSAGVKLPSVRSGLARSFKLKSSIKAKDVLIGKVTVPPGSIIVWERGNTINGHTGLVRKWYVDWGLTVEGNTSGGDAGSQSDGDGFWSKSRNIEPANYFRITAFTLVTY